VKVSLFNSHISYVYTYNKCTAMFFFPNDYRSENKNNNDKYKLIDCDHHHNTVLPKADRVCDVRQRTFRSPRIYLLRCTYLPNPYPRGPGDLSGCFVYLSCQQWLLLLLLLFLTFLEYNTINVTIISYTLVTVHARRTHSIIVYAHTRVFATTLFCETSSIGLQTCTYSLWFRRINTAWTARRPL